MVASAAVLLGLLVPQIAAVPSAQAASGTNALRVWADDASPATAALPPVEALEPEYTFPTFAGWSSAIEVVVRGATASDSFTVAVNPAPGRELAAGDLVVENMRTYGATAGTGGHAAVGGTLVDLDCSLQPIVSVRIEELQTNPLNTAVTSLALSWGVECGSAAMHGTLLWNASSPLVPRTALFANGPSHAPAGADLAISGLLAGPSGALAGRVLQVTRIDDRGVVDVAGVNTDAAGRWSVPADFWQSDASYTVEYPGDAQLARAVTVRLVSRDKVAATIRLSPTPVTRVGSIVHLRGALLTPIGVGTPTRLSLMVDFPSGGFLSSNVVTAADGTFDLPLVQQATSMSVSLSLFGHPYFLSTGASVTVRGFESTSLLTLLAPRSATRGVAFRVTGKLVSGGAPLPRARILVRWGDPAGGGSAYATTAVDGSYSARIVPVVGGDMRIVADFQGLPGWLSAESGVRGVNVVRAKTTLILSADKLVYRKGQRAQLTIRLGRTYDGRVVRVFVRPTSQVSAPYQTVVATVVVPASGSIVVSYPVTGNVTFTAGYLGDSRYLPVRAAVSVRAV